MVMELINGWSEADILMLIKRTGQMREDILHFCEAIDKPLYLILSTEMKRSTLHFHLCTAIVPPVQESKVKKMPVVAPTTVESENIVPLKEYRRRRAKG
jgi:hypothetical protein